MNATDLTSILEHEKLDPPEQEQTRVAMSRAIMHTELLLMEAMLMIEVFTCQSVKGPNITDGQWDQLNKACAELVKNLLERFEVEGDVVGSNMEARIEAINQRVMEQLLVEKARGF